LRNETVARRVRAAVVTSGSVVVKMRELTLWVVVTVAAVNVVGSAACDRGQSDKAAPFASTLPAGGFNQPRQGRSFAIGERAEVPELAVTAEGTKDCGGEHLRRGNVLIGVELLVEGRSAGEVHFNPFHCKLRESDGASHTPTFKGCEPRLRDHRLGKGERQRGWVSFELPATAKELRLVCSQAVVGQQTRVLEFDLSGR
jgi:hypothetical protein